MKGNRDVYRIETRNVERRINAKRFKDYYSVYFTKVWFKYTVQPVDSSADLDYAATDSLTLNGNISLSFSKSKVQT